VTLVKRLSSLALHPEISWRNIGLCASCLGMDAIRLGQWYQSVHPIPTQMEESLLAEMHAHNVLDGLILSGQPEDLTWWELTAKMMARAITLLDGVPQVDYPYDKRLDGAFVADAIFEEALKGFFNKFFTEDFQRNRYGHPCTCTLPGEVQPYCPDAFRGRFSVLARCGANLQLHGTEEVVMSNI
jgi:hypothetical protein